MRKNFWGRDAVFAGFVYLYGVKQKLQISNRSLVEECRNGDKEALNLFYLRFAPRMLSVIHRYIRDEKDAEDVLHDGFIVALTRLDSLRDADKVELWLATIMKNLSLQFLQSQDMAQILHDIPEVEDTAEIDDILDFNTLESLIAKLPAGYQKVFRLAILENKSHKEIGKLLGIAPNSSSSQLFHAKLMMRKLIKDYKLQAGLGCLLIIGVLSTLFIRNRHTFAPVGHEILIANVIDTVSESEPDTLLKSADNPMRNTTAHNSIKTQKISPINQEALNSEQEEADSIASVEEPAIAAIDSVGLPLMIEEEYYGFIENEPEKLPLKGKSAGGWALNVGADTGLLSFNSLTIGDYCQSAGPGGNLENPNNPDPENPDEKENAPKMMRRTGGYQDYSGVNHSNSLPVSVAFSVSRSLDDIFSVEGGVRYTYLHSTFETSAAVANCHWHYLGIPLKLNVKIYAAHRFKLYAGVGGAMDIPLYSNAVVTASSANPDLKPGRFSSPVMWSLQGNLGVALKLSKRVDLFLEPTLQYHFDQDYTVPNTWTDNRWGISLPLGLRLNF